MFQQGIIWCKHNKIEFDRYFCALMLQQTSLKVHIANIYLPPSDIPYKLEDSDQRIFLKFLNKF